MKIKIRKIETGDTKAITELTKQLGSEVAVATVDAQISEIIRNPDHFTYVAVFNDEIVGYIHCFRAVRISSEPFIEISGLVVNEDYRGNGLGKMLVQKVESLKIDCTKVRVRCNAKREKAHKFYLQQDYILKKDQKIFEKNF